MNLKSGLDCSTEDLEVSETLLDVRHGNFKMKLNELQNLLKESKQELEPTLESLTSWLANIIPVELVAYWNPRNHLTCLHHGNKTENNQELLAKSQAIIGGPLPRIRHWRQEKWLFHLWTGEPLDKWDRLMVVESGTGMTVEESNVLLEEALNVLQEPLKNAIHNTQN